MALAVPAALETPVTQARIPGMHTGENLVRANAATAQVSALASLGAPVLGGVLYAAWGMDAAPVSYTHLGPGFCAPGCGFPPGSPGCFTRLSAPRWAWGVPFCTRRS